MAPFRKPRSTEAALVVWGHQVTSRIQIWGLLSGKWLVEEAGVLQVGTR